MFLLFFLIYANIFTHPTGVAILNISTLNQGVKKYAPKIVPIATPNKNNPIN